MVKMEEGMLLESLLWLRSSDLSEERFAISGGMVPCRLKLERFKVVTLWLLTSQMMPIQLQIEAFEVQFVPKRLVGS